MDMIIEQDVICMMF